MSFEWKKNVAHRFDDCANEYDRHSAIQEKIAQTLAADLPDIENPLVLEIGCGTGALTQRLLKCYPGGRFHITDISAHMVDRARSRIGEQKNVRWSVMDGESPAKDQHYDIIVSNMAFQWFGNPHGTFETLLGLLESGGVIFYTVPAPESFPEWRASLKEFSLDNGLLNFESWPGVFREDEIVEHHQSTLHFLRNLKKGGMNTPRIGYKTLSRKDLLKTCRYADESFHGQVTWHILYGRIQG
ncbi:MAG TPA: methyltransferase [Alphaproteobacteria bacterium]|nr:methyltransferase domain-containing protein [Alphaproteobacteria bacterium]USO05042.1 MAG: methyltransferase domain-containing protein [Rhodospirillales bacterium]HOO81695.1 methyltransferase [Alphaproteobacteria bacterium]